MNQIIQQILTDAGARELEVAQEVALSAEGFEIWA